MRPWQNRWRPRWLRKGILIGVGIFVVFTGAQFYCLHRIDAFFGTSAVQAEQAVHAPKLTAKANKKPSVAPLTAAAPPDASMAVYNPGSTEVAYVNVHGELVVATTDKTVFQQDVGHVAQMQWLGNSGTLLYFVQGTSLQAYLLQHNQQTPVSIGTWSGTSSTIENIYFSPYLEYLYIELSQGGYDQLYKYDAVIGMKQLPLGYIKIASIQYNAKQDTMAITDSNGHTWHYANNHLTY